MTPTTDVCLEDLLAMEPVRLAGARTNGGIPQEHGVYLFSERNAHLFVGKAEGMGGIRSRVGQHAARFAPPTMRGRSSPCRWRSWTAGASGCVPSGAVADPVRLSGAGCRLAAWHGSGSAT